MNNQQDDLTKLIARYLIVNLQGGGNPMYETDEMGVKSKGMDISCLLYTSPSPRD